MQHYYREVRRSRGEHTGWRYPVLLICPFGRLAHVTVVHLGTVGLCTTHSSLLRMYLVEYATPGLRRMYESYLPREMRSRTPSALTAHIQNSNPLRLHSKKLDSGNVPHIRQLHSTFNSQFKELCGVGLTSRSTCAPVHSEVRSISPPVRLIQQNTRDEQRVSHTVEGIRTSNYYTNTTMRASPRFADKTRMRY